MKMTEYEFKMNRRNFLKSIAIGTASLAVFMPGLDTLSCPENAPKRSLDEIVDMIKYNKIKELNAMEGGIFVDIDNDGLYTDFLLEDVSPYDTPENPYYLHKHKKNPSPQKLEGRAKELFERLKKEGFKPKLGIRGDYHREPTEFGKKLTRELESGKRNPESVTDYDREMSMKNYFTYDIGIFVESSEERKFAEELDKLRKSTPDGVKIEYKRTVYEWKNGLLNYTIKDGSAAGLKAGICSIKTEKTILERGKIVKKHN